MQMDSLTTHSSTEVEAPLTPDPESWELISSVFAAMGRVVILLDSQYTILCTGPHFDRLLCPDSATRMVGHRIDGILSSRPLNDAVHEGRPVERLEGLSAFVKCIHSGTQLVSLSIAPLSEETAAQLGADAQFLVVLRPSDPDDRSSMLPLKYGLMARSQAMLGVVNLIEVLQDSEASVLITGETGVGKGVVAAAIHAHSRRRDGPFVTVDAGALPGNLLESELFGHVRGAFTGAIRDREGRVESARGGTLFLDEIGDLSLPLQGKLLRLLQEHEYYRVGESTPRQMDSRIIAATNVDLEKRVAEGTFREDLYYRLRVVPIHVPPLRVRADEIEPLARYLLPRLSRETGRSLILGGDAVEEMKTYAWPGNVRQLQNALNYAQAVCRGQTIHAEHLPPEVRGLDLTSAEPAAPFIEPPGRRSGPLPLESLRPLSGEAPCTEDCDKAPSIGAESHARWAETVTALDTHHWNRGATAKALGISRTTLWRRMKEMGLD